MELKTYCQNLTRAGSWITDTSNPVGLRIMCPEYSSHLEDVKTYPLPKEDHLFALCWNIKPDRHLSATILPSEMPFSYHCEFSPDTRTQLHTHEYLELSYIVDGEFRQRILGKDIVFQKGDLCLLDKNCRHQDYLHDQSATILFLGIANAMFDDIMCRHVATERIVSFLHTALLKQKDFQQYLHFKPHANASVKMEETLLSLLKELICHDEASSYICGGLLLRIFHLLSTEYDFLLSKELRKEMNWLLFEEITEFIRAHLKNISIRMLAEQFHFQEDYFNRLLKSKTGLTYTEYLQNIRISKAEELLKHTDHTIEQIAEEIGYRNKGYFYKIFTERHQITPAQFRKKILP